MANRTTSHDGDSGAKANVRKALNVPFLAATLLGLAATLAALYFVRGFQVRRMAESVRERAESLAKEQRFSDASAYLFRYLQLRPDDVAARVRLAEVFDQSGVNPRRSLELYQEALGAADHSAGKSSAQDALPMRRRIVELLLEGGAYPAAESEAEQVSQLERKLLTVQNAAEWRGPGLKALAVYGQFRAKTATVPASLVDRAFRRVLEPAAGEPCVYQDSRVYLARYEYRRQQRLPNADDDLAAALRVAPHNLDVLLTAAVHAHQQAVAAKTQQSFSAAERYYRLAIEAATADTRAYLALGQLFVAQGNLPQAVATWRAGLKAGDRDVSIHLALADAMIQSGRLDDAEAVLQSLDQVCRKLRSQTQVIVQPLIDLRRGQIAMFRGDYTKAISLVKALAGDNEAVAQPESGRRATYQACMVLGAANAGLKRWNRAIAAYDQAVALGPRELSPQIGAIAASVAGGDRSAAIRYCRQALTVANAMQPPPARERLQIYQQLILLLEKESRSDEAGRYRELCIGDIAASPELTARWAEEALWNSKPEEAVGIAERAVKSRPKDPTAYVSLGRACLAKGDTSKAGQAFQDAVRIAPDDVHSLEVLFQFHVDAGDRERALATLAQLAQHVKLTDAQRCLVLADGYAKLGDAQLACDAFRKANTAMNGDPAAQTRLAEAFLNMDDADCVRAGEDSLRSLAKTYPPARSRLAERLLGRGTTAAWDEGRRLLAENPDKTSNTDRMILALALIRRGGQENLAKAESLCHEVLSHGKESAASGDALELLLAQIEQAQGKLEQARQRYQTLADRSHAPAPSVAVYAQFVIQHGPASEVERRLNQLDEAAPGQVAALELRTKWMAGQDRRGEIEKTVENWARRTLPTMSVGKRVELCDAIGDLYRRAELYACAERWYRRVTLFAPKRVDPLASAIAAQGRVSEALGIVEKAGLNDSSARPAISTTKLLLAGQATPEDFARCEPLLEKALTAHPDNAELLLNAAAVRILQGKIDEAIALYRRVLSKQPEQIAALNNLASLLAESSLPEKRREAREFIDRAIEVFGPRPELLDTKGTILLGDEKPEQAVALLEKAAAASSPDPRSCLHLAVAYYRLGKLDQARDTLKRAHKTNVSRQVLTQTDRTRLSELDEKLGS